MSSLSPLTANQLLYNCLSTQTSGEERLKKWRHAQSEVFAHARLQIRQVGVAVSVHDLHIAAKPRTLRSLQFISVAQNNANDLCTKNYTLTSAAHSLLVQLMCVTTTI